MNDFERFLNPERKPNIRFVLSEEFIGEDGKPLVWEMRQLSAAEGLEIERLNADRGDTEVLIAMAASSLVVPDLKDQKLLEALSEKAKTTVLSPSQAAKAMLTMAELFKLMKVYHSFCKMGESVEELIAKAKN